MNFTYVHKVLVSFKMDLREEGGNKGTVCKILESLHHHMSVHQKVAWMMKNVSRRRGSRVDHVTYTPNAMPLERGSFRKV